MSRSDTYSALALVVLALAVGAQARKYPLGSLKIVGPGFFPLVLAIFLGLLSVALLLTSLRLREKGRKFSWPKQWFGPVVVLVLLFAYGFFLKYLGFPLTTFLFSLTLFKYGYPSRWVIPIGGALTTTVLVLLIFKIWLGTPFPPGIMGY